MAWCLSTKRTLPISSFNFKRQDCHSQQKYDIFVVVKRVQPLKIWWYYGCSVIVSTKPCEIIIINQYSFNSPKKIYNPSPCLINEGNIEHTQFFKFFPAPPSSKLTQKPILWVSIHQANKQHEGYLQNLNTV